MLILRTSILAITVGICFSGVAWGETTDSPAYNRIVTEANDLSRYQLASAQYHKGLIAESRPSMSVLAQARRCIKLCPADHNPCDPMIYKIADGRCNPVDR
jgi:hypothetical protein